MEEFALLEKGMELIEAQKLLTELSLADYPHMKKQDREKYHHKIKKVAYPSKRKELTPEEFLLDLRNKFG